VVEIGSGWAVVFFVFSDNAGQSTALPKLVCQLPSAAPSFNCKLHRFDMREKTTDLVSPVEIESPTRIQNLKMPTPEFETMQASAPATQLLRWRIGKIRKHWSCPPVSLRQHQRNSNALFH